MEFLQPIVIWWCIICWRLNAYNIVFVNTVSRLYKTWTLWSATFDRQNPTTMLYTGNNMQQMYNVIEIRTFFNTLILRKSLIAEWLEQVSKWHEMCCHDLEVMSFELRWVELGVRSTSVLSHTWTTKSLLLPRLPQVAQPMLFTWAG